MRNQQKVYDAIAKNQWTEELLAETKLSSTEQDELRHIAKIQKAGHNALMIACEDSFTAVNLVCKLISQLPSHEQQIILLAKVRLLKAADEVYALELLLDHLISTMGRRSDRCPEAESLKNFLQLLVKLPENEIIDILRTALVKVCNRGHHLLAEILCSHISSLPIENQMAITIGSHKNILFYDPGYKNLFPPICQLFERFPQDVLINLLTESDGDGKTVLANAIFPNSCVAVAPVCDLIKKIPQLYQIQIFNQQMNCEIHTVFNKALENVCNHRDSALDWDKGMEKSARVFFDNTIHPLLEIVKNFPLENKAKIFFEIPNSVWYRGLYSDEREAISTAIGVTRPFNTRQKILFTCAAGATAISGSMWLLIVTGVITSSSFVAVALPFFSTLMFVGAAVMLGVWLYARKTNPVAEYKPCEDICFNANKPYDHKTL